MNIVINALSARWGGGQAYLLNLLKYADRFPDMKFYLLSSSLPENGLKKVEMIQPNFNPSNIVLRALWERYCLPKLLQELRADVLFCPGGTLNTSPPPGCVTAVAFRNMLIFDTDSRQKYPPGYMLARLLLLERLSKSSFEKADLVIFISRYAKQVVDRKVPRRKGRSVVITHGIDDKFRTYADKNISRPDFLPEGDYLLYVSPIDVFKAQIEVVWAYHLLCQKRQTKEKLILLGPNHTAYATRVREEIERLGLRGRVITAGTVPYADMPAVYHYSKAHIFASTCENCPNVVIESLGSGRPLFLSDRAPMPELAGDAAVYFDPEKPQELAGVLLKHLDDEQWMVQMGRKAHERSFRYSWQITAKKTFQSMLELCMGDSS
jgi:glycosyltransferase involved in cell wall biosynthesis